MNFKTRFHLTIGLTGTIACGKSTTLAAWQKAGVFVLSCDELVREISARPAVAKKISSLLGTTNKVQLAAKIFKSPAARKKLEQLLHPLVLKEVAKRLKTAKQWVRVVEVPLLFEADLKEAFDLTVVVWAPEKQRKQWAAKRGLSCADLEKRSKAQWPQDAKVAQADICIINEGPKSVLERKIYSLQKTLQKIYTAK